MEKLVYVLLGAGRFVPGEVAAGLERAGLCRVVVNVADEDVAAKRASRIARVEPVVGAVVSGWLEDVEARAAVEAVLTPRCARLAGYSVLESVALANARAARGERTPGVNVVACIAAAPGLARELFLRRWLDDHRVVALETQATHAYVRNVVVRALTPDAPAWDGIVEEGFATEAVGDPLLWYKTGGSRELLAQRLERMLASCREFLDLARVESHPLSEYRFDQ